MTDGYQELNIVAAIRLLAPFYLYAHQYTTFSFLFGPQNDVILEEGTLCGKITFVFYKLLSKYKDT